MIFWVVVLFSFNHNSYELSFNSKKDAYEYAESFLKKCKIRKDFCKAAVVERK